MINPHQRHLTHSQATTNIVFKNNRTNCPIFGLNFKICKNGNRNQRIDSNPSTRKCQALHVGLRSCMLHHHLLHEDNECSRTDFTMELRRRYNYILHKFLADRADLFGQCGTEHHDLLLMWCHAENFLNISSHIWK